MRGQSAAIEQLRRERDSGAESESNGDAAPAEDGGSSLTDAHRSAAAALERRRDAPLIAARLDARSLPVRADLQRLEIAAYELEEAWLAARLERLHAELGERSTAALRELSAELQRLIAREPDLDSRSGPAVAALRDGIDGAARTQIRIRELQRERQRYGAIEDDLAGTLESVRERLEVSGLTDALGTLFLEEQRRLRALGDLHVALDALEQEIAQSRLRAIALRESVRALPEPSGSVLDDGGAAALRDLERRVVDAQLQGEETLIEQLRGAESRLRAVIERADELGRILRETLLWWPSHVPISAEWLQQVPHALVALIEPAAWRETRAALRAVTLESPGNALMTLALVGLLFRAGRRTGSHLRRLAERTRHRFTDSIGLTYKAMGWSLLRVLPAPVLLMALSLRLEQVPDAHAGVDILAAVLSTAAVWWLAGHLLALFISRNGVATVHLGWNATLLERLRRDVKWYMPIQFVLIMCLALAFMHPNELVFDVFGRAGLVAAGALSALLAWRLLAPEPAHGAAGEFDHGGKPEPAHGRAAEPDHDGSGRRRSVLRILAVAYAAALVVLALAGYLLTAGELLARTIDTAVVLIIAGLGYRLAMRALILSETRLRIRRMREQRESAAALESNSLTSDGVDLPEPHLSIADVNQQTRTLIGALTTALTALGLFWVWSDVLPALTWLDGVTLWSRTIGEGDAEVVSRISLQDLLLAASLGALLALAARNLPGLVEILLARSTRMDGAGRYTVTTLLRYGITVVAVVSVFSLLGLRWSELQWMVAALTLGLGFGLQEVVANFVSGVIILFERPARVGDTITIGEYSGTVAKIRTRATTIIDWDNREVVVPNKNFITERLINWTLSDTMTRIVLPVRVTHDADPELVIETLIRVASEHPAVLEEPEPAALFLQLGDSALHFELRVYVEHLSERLETTSDLHRGIVKAFREIGISIPYPQMDLHIRDVPSRRGRMLSRSAGQAEPPPELPTGPDAAGLSGVPGTFGVAGTSGTPGAPTVPGVSEATDVPGTSGA